MTHTTRNSALPSSARSLAWSGTMALTAVGGSVVAACMMPFVAVATMTAATLPRGGAVATVLVAWGANQLLGFGLLGYPLDGNALGWGVALGVAALLALAVAWVVGVRPGRSPVRTVLAAVLGFAAFELALYAYAGFAGGRGTFTPAIIGLLARNEAMWLAGLLAVHALLGVALPRWFARPGASRLAR